MTCLEAIKQAYDYCKIVYVVRERGEYEFLFTTNERRTAFFEQEDLDYLLRTERFIEFHNGELASY